ncbi:cytochrome P450, partial [Streptomyces sp. SID11233]|nr:cytochrome P450 [Streptomyces sp. SID11233]
ARITDELLDEWAPGEPFDFVARLAVPLPVAVICELLGVPDEDRPSIRRWSAELFTAGAPNAIDAASHSLATYMTELVASKRAHPGTTLLDRLIA